jgi:hypothetical protein
LPGRGLYSDSGNQMANSAFRLSGVTAEAKTQLCLHCVCDKSCVGSVLLAILKAEAQLWLAKGQKAKAKAKHKSVQNAKTAALKV